MCCFQKGLPEEWKGKANPCPYCKSTDLFVDFHRPVENNDYYCFIECRSCGARSGKMLNTLALEYSQSILDRWNSVEVKEN